MRAISLVVDASVAVQWYLDDEPHAALARVLLTSWRDGRVNLVEPVLWPFEVANALARATRRKRLKRDESARYLARFLRMGVATVDVSRHLVAIDAEAHVFDRSVYDMSYVYLAAQHGIEVVTADDKLFGAVEASKPFVKHIRDYKLPQPS